MNTLVFDERGITGSNTDCFGFKAGLDEAGVAVDGARVLVLGGGGGARAVCAALQHAGAAVTLANRGSERAERVAAALPGLEVTGWDQRGLALAECDLVVNTTSLGMAGSEPLTLDLERAKCTLCVADIVYVPLETPLLAQARAAGLSGLVRHRSGRRRRIAGTGPRQSQRVRGSRAGEIGGRNGVGPRLLFRQPLDGPSLRRRCSGEARRVFRRPEHASPD